MDNLAYQDDIRFEKINGQIVAMSPSPLVNHSMIVGNIYTLFKSYLKGKTCRTFSDNVDVHLDEHNTFIPDVTIVCKRDIIKPNGIYGTPDLVVEILSPSTSRRDKKEKKDAYEKHGVKEYWIVSPNDKSVEVHLLKNDTFVLDNVYTVYPDYLLEKMSPEDKSKIIEEFKVSLFDDLIIKLDDVFESVIS